MAPAFKIWFRKSRTTLIDMHFDAIFNKVNHSIPSAKNQNKWFMKLGTSNCANYSMWNPKHSAKFVCRTGTSALSTARAGTSCEMERRRTRNLSSTLSIFLSIPIYYIKKGRPHGHRYGKKPGDHEYFTANSLKKKCKKKNFLGIHDWFIRDEKFCKNIIDVGRNEEMCREMDKLANEDHTHRITEEEIRVYRNNWWIRSNIVGSDTMPVRHRADFKQALSTLRQLKNQEDTAYCQKWQSSFSSWWNLQESWWHSSSEHHRDDGPSTDWSGKLVEKWLGYLFEVWFSELIVQNYSSKFGNSQQQFTVTDGGYKQCISHIAKFYEKWLRRKAVRTSVRWTNNIITNNNWIDTHNMQLTMHNKYTNDDVHTKDCVVHIVRWART